VVPKVTRAELLALTAILAAFLPVLVYLAWRTGVTVDEPAHLLSAHLYWKGQDVLAPHDMPPLIKIVGGWVSLLTGLPIPYDATHIWRTQHEWNISQEMMSRLSREQLHRVFFHSRLPLLVFPTGALLLLWWWARQLFAPTTALAAAGVWAMMPSVLGLGALFKNDLAAAATYLLFCYRTWVFWRHPSLGNVLWVALGVLLATMAKLSLLLLLPLAPLMLIARFLAMRPIPAWKLLAALAAGASVVYVGWLFAYQFDAASVSDEQLLAARNRSPFFGILLPAAYVFRFVPLPLNLWLGATSLLESDAGNTAVYMLGKVYEHGSPWYFLVCVAVKVPIALQVLVLAGLAAALRGLLVRNPFRCFLLLLLPIAFYAGLASLSNLQLGFRLILPCLPFAVLLAAAAIEHSRNNRARFLIMALLFWLLLRAATAFPHYISYFNLWIGHDDPSYYLSDSNIDWGQDLPELERVMRDLGNPRFYFYYFGNDNPHAYFAKSQMVRLPPPWDDSLAAGIRAPIQPGVYAISVSLLTGQFFQPKYRDFFAYFRGLKPFARAGNSIYIYRVE
jgi:hypothetical protein